METVAREGIPFVRVPRGPGRELIVGINRKGLLGVSLKDTAREDVAGQGSSGKGSAGDSAGNADVPAR